MKNVFENAQTGTAGRSGEEVSLTFFDEAVANAVTRLERGGDKIFDAHDVHSGIYGENCDPLKPVEVERINSSIDKLRNTVVTNGEYSTPILSCDRVIVNGDRVSYVFVSPRLTANRGTTWHGLDAEAMASMLDDLRGAGALDDDTLNEWLDTHGMSYTDCERVTIAKNHVLMAINELEKVDRYSNVSGIIGILESAEDALADELREYER